MQAGKAIWDTAVNQAGGIFQDLMGSLLGWAIVIAVLIPPFLIIYFLMKKLGYGQSRGAVKPNFSLRMQWSKPVTGQGELPTALTPEAEKEVEAVLGALRAAGLPVNTKVQVHVERAGFGQPAAPAEPAAARATLNASLDGMPQWQRDLIEGKQQEGQSKPPNP